MSAPDLDSDVARRLIGAWRYAGTTVDGAPRADRTNPRGIIIYDRSGHMAVQIMPGREQARTAPPSAFICYFGTWSLDERAGTVTHHREGDLRTDGEIDAVRKYEFVGDRLILRPVDRAQEIMWERIR
ncbi:MAG: lipocalin-like domain-containing protein [Xanthobacteraceae bacterium]|nr:lipocalin-like domain-containing protein [Xanthobacteraceae bacterium]